MVSVKKQKINNYLFYYIHKLQKMMDPVIELDNEVSDKEDFSYLYIQDNDPSFLKQEAMHLNKWNKMKCFICTGTQTGKAIFWLFNNRPTIAQCGRAIIGTFRTI